MKTQRLIIISIAVAFAFVPQLLRTSAAAAEPDNLRGLYAARLISPRPGEVVYPGQKVRVVWESLLPKLPVDLSWCESEIWLSLDGGKSFPFVITPVGLDLMARTLTFDWTVPNTPTNEAVLDIRFGCQQYFPENRSVQARSSFVIAKPGAQ
jgi:hypothetical protein